MKRSLLILITVALSISMLFGCTSSSENDADGGNITEIAWSFTKSNIEIELGETESGYIIATVNNRNDFEPEDIVFVSEDESVATITFSRSALTVYLYFEINAVGVGETYIYASSADGKTTSERIQVSVVGDEDSEATAANMTEIPQTEATDNTAMTQSTEQTDAIAAEEQQAENDDAGSSSAPTVSVSQDNEPAQAAVEQVTPAAADSEYTYVLNTNTKKIHKSDCSSVKRIKTENYATTTDYDGAIAQGYVQCKNCD